MIRTRKPISIKEAVNLVLEAAPSLSIENINLENSFGRVLADDLYAPRPIPWYSRSPYDGYAVFSASTEKARGGHAVSLEVVESDEKASLQTGQAVKVMTGSPLPKGADAVIMNELVRVEERAGRKYIQIKRRLSEGENVSQIGEDIQKGQLLVQKGTIINPGVMAVLAAFGWTHVSTARKPRVGIIAAGDHLSDPDEPFQPGQVRDSNTYMLMAQCSRGQAEAYNYGRIAGSVDHAVNKITDALENVDLLVTTGGVSVGDDDIMQRIYEELEATVLFNKIAMRPGSVTSAAVAHGKLLIGLSGNPSACYAGFELLARPVIRMMLGLPKPYLRRVPAILRTDFLKPSPVTRFVRGRLFIRNGKVYTEPSGKDKSNMISSLPKANSLIVLPAGTKGCTAGSLVDALILEDGEWSGQEWE
ncbi:molybdopterin molybdenumtransferase MoeA [Sporolactobacillus sp. THM7-4]|nr:molybdopterin molybdenumtransferase MoeA [Sporolactobacillus sp. THM7-4]